MSRPRRSSVLTKAEREAADALHSLVYLPCEHCGERKFTALRDLGGGEQMRLCTDCGGNMAEAGS